VLDQLEANHWLEVQQKLEAKPRWQAEQQLLEKSNG
jgi:hypothetical protein